MDRRNLLRRSSFVAAALAARGQLGFALEQPTATAVVPGIRRVLIVSKCHLDVGFTDTQANVVRKYFDVYYPAAIAVAAQLRGDDLKREPGSKPGDRFAEGGQEICCDGPMPQSYTARRRYTWTTGSWLLYTYLEQATPAQRKRMEQAIADGDIAWHALPFSWQTEVLSPSMIAGGLSFSQELDRRFGTKTTGAKMTDVPGHTRGIIAPLAAAGVTLLDIGVNAASTPPEVPDIFRWQDHAGHEITVLYHRHDYGSTLLIPGSDLAVSVEVKNDNGGPHTPEEITQIYQRLHRQFPNAVLQAASLTEVADAVAPYRKHLPTVTGEIGDTWIYGVPSDPPKIARFRELSRLRDEWLAQGRLRVGDAADRAYLQHLLLCAEHTWGTDTKTYLDYQHYRPAEIAAAEAEHLPGYVKMETSWQEKRDNITAAVGTLPTTLQNEANLRLGAVTPASASRAKPATSASDASTGNNGSQAIDLETNELSLKLDPATGAITSLVHKPTRREWASPKNPLALFTYQTLSAEEFDRFIADYLVVKTWWGPRDFGKPEIACFGASTYDSQPRASSLLHEHIGRSQEVVVTWAPRQSTPVRELCPGSTPDPACLQKGIRPRATPCSPNSPENTGLPESLSLVVRLEEDSSTVSLTVNILGKPANRLPEALWLTFNPVASDLKGWLLSKSGQSVLPSEVIEGGSRAMHAVTEEIRFADAHGGMTLRTLDAPVIALGTRSPINFSRSLPDLSSGVHVSLFNNAWGTNYPQWASGDWQFRFSLTLS